MVRSSETAAVVQCGNTQWPEAESPLDQRVVNAIVAADIEHVEELIEAYSIEAGTPLPPTAFNSAAIPGGILPVIHARHLPPP